MTLRVESSTGLSDSIELVVDASNIPPVPVIDKPAVTRKWSVGETLTFHGSATDAEDGPLAASRLHWEVGILHCGPNDCHEHTVQEFDGIPGGTFADHLVFRSGAQESTDAIALIGHLDTVFPPGKFEGYRRDGKLCRGPGVLDMKGGLVVIAFALQALAQTRGLGALTPLRIVVVSDEEVGSPTGQAVIREAIAGSKAALVFESGRVNDAVITRRKGTGAMTAMPTKRARFPTMAAASRLRAGETELSST